VIQRPGDPQNSCGSEAVVRGVVQPTPVDFWTPADPWKLRNCGGLSVFETLHLVSDIANEYQMF